MRFGFSPRSKSFDMEEYQPLPVVYQLRYSILEKVKKGEDPLIRGLSGMKSHLSLRGATGDVAISKNGSEIASLRSQ